MESSMEGPQKTKNKTTIQCRDTTPAHIFEECKLEHNRDTYTSMFIAALFTIAKLWKTECPVSDK
jgi:hypothetical protein